MNGYDSLGNPRRRGGGCLTACLAFAVLLLLAASVVFIILYALRKPVCPAPPPITNEGTCQDPVPVQCNSTRAYSLVDIGQNVTSSDILMCCQAGLTTEERTAFFTLTIGTNATRVLISTCGIMPDQDTVLHIFNETCRTDDCLDCNDDSCSLGSFVELVGVANQTLIIGVTSYTNGWPAMDFPLTITCFDESNLVVSSSVKPPKAA